MKTKGKMTLVIGSIIAIAAIVLIALYIIKDKESSGSILDMSKDYGACDILSVSDIKSTLGEAANNIQGPKNMGIVGYVPMGEGASNQDSDSQICVYAFVEGGTIENGYNSNNGLTVQVTNYASGENKESVIEQIEQDPTASRVDSIGDKAYYIASTPKDMPESTFSFRLHVFKDDREISYTITQPSGLATFTGESARQALESIARRIAG